ncbi:MAG: hypothetical protein NWE99_03290 [Candidatus Bathyarchaeota archaeon]|nr:hypothetical protein [Candidatus Bathyarchaeota archaeon]
MVSKAFRKCVEIIEEILKQGYRLQIPSTHIERIIKLHIGADKRTIEKYTRMLTEDFHFLETTAKNPLGITIYRIDIPTIEQHVSEHMKEKLRQLTLLDVRLRGEEVNAEKV